MESVIPGRADPAETNGQSNVDNILAHVVKSPKREKRENLPQLPEKPIKKAWVKINRGVTPPIMQRVRRYYLKDGRKPRC